MGGVLAEIDANGRFSFGAAIAFVEDQVKHLVYRVEPLDQLAAGGGLEAGAGRPGRTWRR